MDFNYLFPDNREEGETRLRQCQLVMLRMLKIFDYLCTRHQIKYFLTGGSLIGAVRHQGFIPWDDDLDVGMTRDNYEKFIEYAVPELPDDIFFQNIETDAFYRQKDYVDARLRDKYSSYIHKGERKTPWHDGLQVDIFVYDHSFLPHNFFVITQNILLKWLNNYKKRTAILNYIAKYSPFPLVYASSYLQHYGLLKGGTYIKEKEYSNLIKVKFEDMEAWIPKEFDRYLKRQYGNYMQLPPADKRVSNHEVICDPFTPCNHTQILYWEKRKQLNSVNNDLYKNQ
jgi:lipopolysaccharide cholinephosphotransferase